MASCLRPYQWKVWAPFWLPCSFLNSWHLHAACIWMINKQNWHHHYEMSKFDQEVRPGLNVSRIGLASLRHINSRHDEPNTPYHSTPHFKRYHKQIQPKSPLIKTQIKIIACLLHYHCRFNKSIGHKAKNAKSEQYDETRIHQLVVDIVAQVRHVRHRHNYWVAEYDGDRTDVDARFIFDFVV